MNVSKRQLQLLILLTLLSVFMSFLMTAQTLVSGVVTEVKGTPIEGANVYLEGTYDGASTNQNGSFSFETSATDDKRQQTRKPFISSKLIQRGYRKQIPAASQASLQRKQWHKYARFALHHR